MIGLYNLSVLHAELKFNLPEGKCSHSLCLPHAALHPIAENVQFVISARGAESQSVS